MKHLLIILCSLVFVAILISGCSRRHTLVTEPPAAGTDAGNDLRADFVLMSVPPLRREASPFEPEARVPVDDPGGVQQPLPPVVEGIGGRPGLHLSHIGSFPDYGVRFYINDVLWTEGRFSVQAGSGARRSTEIWGRSWVPPDTGLYTFRVVVDADNRCPELDETNNEATIQVRVLPRDLAATVIEFVNEEGGVVQRAKVGTRMRAIVHTAALGRFPNCRRVITADGIRVLDDRRDLVGNGVGSLQADILSFRPVREGRYVVTLSLDPDHEMLELKRDNNGLAATLQVIPGPRRR